MDIAGIENRSTRAARRGRDEFCGHGPVELADAVLFALHRINFWQALGLLVLGKILFGGFRGPRGPHMHWRGRMMERWEKMTPEEREKFREGMKGRCGPFGARTAEPKA